MERAKIGFGKVVINPPLGTLLGGYEFERHAEGIHDNLYARVIVIDKEEKYVFVELDLLGNDKHFDDILAESLNNKYGIKEMNVTVNSIHTHSGPLGIFNSEMPFGSMNMLGTDKDFNSQADSDTSNTMKFKNMFAQFDKTNVDFIIRNITGCVGNCLKDIDYFTYSFINVTSIEGVGKNRRNPSIPIDNNLGILILEKENGKKAVVYNYPCHPTVMHKFNNIVTADYPGEVARLLESQEDIELAVFINGACGDVSTRFTRKDSSFKEVKRIGDILGGELLKQVSLIHEKKELTKIQIKEKEVELEIKALGSIEESEKALSEANKNLEAAIARGVSGGELRLYESIVEGESNNLHLTYGYKVIKSIKFEIKIVKLDDIIMVCIPGELFTSLALRLRTYLDGKNIIVSGYSNGYIGYISDKVSYQEGGYEAASTPLKEGEGEKLIDIINEVIKTM